MLRNYLMPGLALVLLAIFAAPRSTPTDAPEPGWTASRPAAAQQAAARREAKPAGVSQIAGKTLVSPDDVCDLAMNEMHEKLNEFGLDYSEQGNTAAKPAGPAAESMIALVPDPVHTHLALRFDRNIDAIQQALQDRPSEDTFGWIYTSQWLPWDPMPYQASQDPIDRTNLHLFDADRDCAPGFLLFRRNRFQPGAVGDKFLVVFLVGESPTSGILRQDQFINAVRGWRAVERRDDDRAARTSTLRILGPSFSASLSTLDTLLQAEICNRSGRNSTSCIPAAQVVSGSVATSRATILNPDKFPALSAAHFISMNESSRAIQKMLIDYFGSVQHLRPDEIAFVSEDETPFGNLLSSIQHPPGTNHKTGAATAPLPSDAGGTSPEKEKDRPLLFHYPREISQLRNAYEKNSIFSRQSGQQSTDQTQQDLTLSLEDRHEEEDSVPSFSSAQGPVSEESVLTEVTRAMDRERVRVAVINGTDVLDVIFIARYLARSLPNLRVVLLNSDLLFQRSPDITYFRGMMLADTYPLIPDNMQWTGRFLQRADKPPEEPSPFGTVLPDRIFPSFETTGVYNAVRMLELAPFENDENASSVGSNHAGDVVHFQPHHSLWLAEYSDPFRGGSHPPLWLSAVGRGGFWPVALLDQYSSGKGEEKSSDRSGDKSSNEAETNPCATNPPQTESAHGASVPTSLVEICAGNEWHSRDDGSIPTRMFDEWRSRQTTVGPTSIYRPAAYQLLAARLSAVCLLALFILFGLILCVFATVDRWPQYVFDIPGTNGERRAWIVLVIILCYSWIARLLILDLPSDRFFRDPLNCGLLFLEVVLLLFAVWLIRTGLSRRRRWAWACLLIALALLGQILFHWVKPREFAASLFYLYRSQHLFSGVCPVLPFIFLF
ncbi:MAG TPA: hypothetical protein VE178_17665, partial [Silvibacterium sp.]|nr:hypothetical protein [Silvibacterium sp.]